MTDEDYSGPAFCYWCGPGVMACAQNAEGHEVCHQCWLNDGEEYETFSDDLDYDE